MEQIATNVFRLGSRTHNWYLLFDGEDVTVIDAGCAREWPKLERGLAAEGLSVDQVAGFAITHVHGDHFGMAKRATEEGIGVSVHSDDETRALGTYEGRFAVEASDLPLLNPRVVYNFLPLLFAGVTSLDYVDGVETFDDRQTLEMPGHPVAIHTPGHTEGHTMFHCPDLGVLFTGDGLVTMDLLGTGKGPQMMGDVFNLDSEQARNSLDAITELTADLLLPGHGDPWRGSPIEAVSRIRSEPAAGGAS